MKLFINYLAGIGVIAAVYILMKSAPVRSVEPAIEFLMDAFGCDLCGLKREQTKFSRNFKTCSVRESPEIKALELIQQNSKDCLFDSNLIKAADHVHSIVKNSSKTSDILYKAVEVLEDLAKRATFDSSKSEIEKIAVDIFKI